jgi:hypothetical protein
MDSERNSETDTKQGKSAPKKRFLARGSGTAGGRKGAEKSLSKQSANEGNRNNNDFTEAMALQNEQDNKSPRP